MVIIASAILDMEFLGQCSLSRGKNKFSIHIFKMNKSNIKWMLVDHESICIPNEVYMEDNCNYVSPLLGLRYLPFVASPTFCLGSTFSTTKEPIKTRVWIKKIRRAKYIYFYSSVYDYPRCSTAPAQIVLDLFCIDEIFYNKSACFTYSTFSYWLYKVWKSFWCVPWEMWCPLVLLSIQNYVEIMSYN